MIMNRGEVWLIDLRNTEGDEIDKIRYAVIVNDSRIGVLKLRVIVPFTEWQDSFDSKNWLIKVLPDKSNGLRKESAADVFQIKSISTNYFKKQVGQLDSDSMALIEWGLIQVLGIGV